MTRVRAAVVQCSSVASGTAATVSKAVELIQECGRKEAQIVVFPEAFIGGYPKGASFNIFIGARTAEGRDEFTAYHSSAIDVPGPETAAIGKAAAHANAFVTMGVIERDGGTLYCTALYFDSKGHLAGKHRKLMPTAAERLCWGFGDASTIDVVDTPWGKLGAVICWENYMPLLRTAMYGKGISFYCAPTADDRDSWASTMQHIALEGRCFVLSACQYMTRSDFPATMKSRIPEEQGEVHFLREV